MSDCKLDQIYELDLPANKIMVLQAIAKGEISVPRIAWVTKYSKPQVWRIVKALTKDKLVTVARASLGRKRTLYALDEKAIAEWKRREPYQDDEVDYAQPNQGDEVAAPKPDQPNQGDGVSDSQLHQNDEVDGVKPNQDDKVDIVGAPPPNNPPKDKDSKANTNTALSANGRALIDLSPEVAQIMALFKTRPPDIKAVERALETYPFETVYSCVFKAVNNPKVRDPWAYASTAFGDELKTPPSVPLVPPNGHAPPQKYDPSKPPPGFEAEALRVQRQKEMQARKKASGQS